MKQIAFLVLFLIIIPPSAFSASFDCGKAQTVIEKMICNDQSLSALDEQLSVIYKKEIGVSQVKDEYKTEQLKWLKNRSNCTTSDCLVLMYQKRIDELGNPNYSPAASTVGIDLNCNNELSELLDSSLQIAKAIPIPENAFSLCSTEGCDSYWVKDTYAAKQANSSDIKYLIHDISISYAKIGCVNRAISIARQIANIGIRDSAFAQIANEAANYNNFFASKQLIKIIRTPRAAENSRDYVGLMLIKAGKLEEGKELIRGVGYLDNHLESFWYKYAMGLAESGHENEAIDYAIKLGSDSVHSKNILSALLLLFQKQGKHELTSRIAQYFEKIGADFIPPQSVIVYYAVEGDFPRAYKYLDLARKSNISIGDLAYLVFYVSARDSSIKGKENYEDMLKKLDAYYKNNGQDKDIFIVLAYKYMADWAGWAESNKFLYKYFNKTDSTPFIAHGDVVKKLFEEGKTNKIIEYLDYLKSIGVVYKSDASIRVLVGVRDGSLKIIPKPDDTQIIATLGVAIELVKYKYDYDKTFDYLINFIPPTNESFVDYYQLLARAIAHDRGILSAKSYVGKFKNPSFQAAWLLGIAQLDMYEEIVKDNWYAEKF